MNRKGDVPVAMLAVIALGLVIYAGFAFATLYKGFGGVSTDYSDLVSRANLNENYILSISKNAAISAIKLKEMNDSKVLKELFIQEVEKSNIPKLEGMGNYFGKVRNGEFLFEIQDGKYYLEINGLFVRSIFKNSEITRNFNITMIIP